MGGVAVLHPQDVLKDRFPRQNLGFSLMKVSQSHNPNPNSNATLNNSRSNRRKRSPPKFPKKKKDTPPPTASASQAAQSSNLVMGQVKILKRGELLSEAPKAQLAEETKENRRDVDALILSSTDRLGPEPEIVPKGISLMDFYAGSAFVTSPPPSSLPVPAFFKKKSIFSDNSEASSDLRRILGLDLA